MGAPSRRAARSRRCLAGFLAILCALESGALPAIAATKTVAAEASSPAAIVLDPAMVPAPLSAPARRRAANEAPLPDLLVPGVTAGRLRAAGRALVVDAPDNCRAEVAKWVTLTLEEALAGLSDSLPWFGKSP